MLLINVKMPKVVGILTLIIKINTTPEKERSGSVVECLNRDGGASCWSLTGIVSLSKNINASLVLVQPRKTRPLINERLLMGCKESNQTKTPGSSYELKIQAQASCA